MYIHVRVPPQSRPVHPTFTQRDGLVSAAVHSPQTAPRGGWPDVGIVVLGQLEHASLVSENGATSSG